MTHPHSSRYSAPLSKSHYLHNSTSSYLYPTPSTTQYPNISQKSRHASFSALSGAPVAKFLPSKHNWSLFQHYMREQVTHLGASVTPESILYHIYHIKDPDDLHVRAWDMALRYWKEPFEVFERDMKWIWEREREIGDVTYVNGILAASRRHDESLHQQERSSVMRSQQQSYVAPGELTALSNVRTYVDDRLIYRGSDGGIYAAPAPQKLEQSALPQQQHAAHSHRLHAPPHQQHHSAVSPIVHRNSGVVSLNDHTSHDILLSTSSLGRHLDAVVASTPHPNAYQHVSFAAPPGDDADSQEPSSRSSSQSSNTDFSFVHRNVTPRKYRQTQMTLHEATPQTPPSKRSLFIETASSNKTTNFITGHSAVLHFETIGTQTTYTTQQQGVQVETLTESSAATTPASPQEARRWQLESERKDSLITNLQKELQKAREYTQKLELEHAEQLESMMQEAKASKNDNEVTAMLEMELSKIRQQVQGLQHERSQLTQRISTLQSSTVDVSEVESLQRKIRQIQSERDDAEELNQKLKRKISSLESALEAAGTNQSVMSRTEPSFVLTTTTEIAPSLLTQNEVTPLSSLIVELYLCIETEDIQEQFRELLQDLIDTKIVENAIRCQLAGDRSMFTDPEHPDYVLFEAPCVLQGVCTILLRNGSKGDALPVLWNIDEEASITVRLIEDESPLEVEYQSLRSFVYQLACDLDKEQYGEKWLQVLQNQFEVSSTLHLLDFTTEQWSALTKQIPHGTVLKMQENVYRLDLCNRSEPSEGDLQTNVHLYLLKVKQYFHYMAANVEGVQLLDKNAVNIGVRELSKKYFCKHELKEVNVNFLKVIASESVNLLASFKSVLLHGPKGAAQNHLVQLLPPLVGFTRLSDWDLVHHDQSKLRTRAEATGLEFFPCALCITDFHEYPQNIQIDILNVVEQLRNVILFVSSESNTLPSMVVKRISFHVHVGVLNARDRWKFVRRISNESGIQVEDSEQRNMLISVTTNYTYESMKNLVEWLPVLAKERGITSWMPDVVVPCAARIAKQFSIRMGQYTVPRAFREWSKLQLPSFVSPIQESQKYRGIFLVHTGRHPLQARFQLLTSSTAHDEVRPELTLDSKFKRSSALMECQLLPSRILSNSQLYESLIAVFVQFGIAEQVDYIAMVDATSCVEECGSLQDEGKIIEYIEHVIAECQQYARALLLFDMDGLAHVGKSLWKYIVHACSSRALHNHLDKKNHHAQTAAFWIGCITKQDDANLALENAFKFPRTEASFKYEMSQLAQKQAAPAGGAPQESSKSQKCKTCGHEYIPSEHEICCFHSGDLVEIDRATGEANPTDKRTALLQEFIFRERSNILIWTCCYNAVHHEGCKRMQHSNTIDKKKLFADEARDNFEMIKVNPILLRQAFASRPKPDV